MSEMMFDIEDRPSKLGAFARAGGYLELHGDWVPGSSPEDAAAILMQIAGYYEGVQVPLEAAKAVAIEDTKKRFDTETSPDDEPWAKLQEEYRQWKMEHGYDESILQLEGLLKDAATSENAWHVVGATLVFDPSVLPKAGDPPVNYGMVHQRGSFGGFETLPHHEFVPGEGQVEVGRKQFKGVPARPFIGLSNEAVAKISAEFETWSAGWGRYIEPPGLGMGSNVLGEFPIAGFYGEQPLLRLPSGRVSFGRIPR